MKLFTVGPVEMHEETLEVSGRQVPYFRNAEFSAVYLDCEQLMKQFVHASADDKFILLTSSGTGAMESLVVNCFAPGDKALVIDGGSFGHRFVQLCEVYGVDHVALRLSQGEALVAEHLAAYDNAGFSHMLVNLDETSTGQLYDLALLSDFCLRNNMFLLVDAVSAFTADKIDFTKQGIDALITGSQKGLSLSPGLAFVILGTRLYEQRVKDARPSSMYFNYNDYIENGVRGQTPFTPAVGIVYELQARLHAIQDAGGIEAIVRNTAELAADFRSRIRPLGIAIPDYPLSNAVTPIFFDGVSAMQVQQLLVDEFGFVLNPCSGDMADTALRVGHMGNLSIQDNQALVAALREIVERLGACGGK